MRPTKRATRDAIRALLPLLSLFPLGAVTACRPAPIRPAPLRAEVTLPPTPTLPPNRGAIIGVVADSALGYPVENAFVFFTADTAGTLFEARPIASLPSDSTDFRGAFTLPNLPPATYTLVTRAVNYVSARRVVVVRSSRVDTIAVRLQWRGTAGVGP